MIKILSIVLSVACYLSATFVELKWLRLGEITKCWHRVWWVLGVVAIVCHGFLLHRLIDIGGLQNLSVVNLLSMIIWLVAVFVVVVNSFNSFVSFGYVVFPLAVLSLVAVVLFPGANLINTRANPTQLVHILLSVFTASVLAIAGFHAIFLAFHQWSLRSKRFINLAERMPSIELRERWLFQVLLLCFCLLSVVLGLSIYLLHELALQQLLQKTALVILSWAAFGGLLLGRYRLGWRGRRVTILVLLSVVLLGLSFFGGAYSLI